MAFNKRMDWVPCESYSLPVTYEGESQGIGPLLSIGLCQNDDRVDTGGSVNVGRPDTQSGFTVKAIRGQVLWGLRLPPDTAEPVSTYGWIEINERIHVGMVDFADDNSITYPIVTTFSATDGNERFLWSRHRHYDISSFLGGGLNGTDGFTIPFTTANGTDAAWTAVEVQSERRINQGEILLYTVQARISATNPATYSEAIWRPQFKPYLRTLVRM